MQNQDHTDGKKMSKQEYNRVYYQKHKERLQKKKKETMQDNILPLFETETIAGSRTTRLKKFMTISLRTLEILALVVLTISMTYFQIHESGTYYREASDSIGLAYFKAGLIETTVILCSFARSRVPMIRWSQRATLLLLCALTLTTMSGRITRDASVNTTKAVSIQETIRDLEAERAQKDEIITNYVRLGRITMAKQYEADLDAVRKKLDTARHSITTVEAPRVIATGMIILIGIRIAAMLINLICIHRLAEILNLNPSQHRF